jgi:hypothetical protein
MDIGGDGKVERLLRERMLGMIGGVKGLLMRRRERRERRSVTVVGCKMWVGDPLGVWVRVLRMKRGRRVTPLDPVGRRAIERRSWMWFPLPSRLPVFAGCSSQGSLAPFTPFSSPPSVRPSLPGLFLVLDGRHGPRVPASLRPGISR